MILIQFSKVLWLIGCDFDAMSMILRSCSCNFNGLGMIWMQFVRFWFNFNALWFRGVFYVISTIWGRFYAILMISVNFNAFSWFRIDSNVIFIEMIFIQFPGVSRWFGRDFDVINLNDFGENLINCHEFCVFSTFFGWFRADFLAADLSSPWCLDDKMLKALQTQLLRLKEKPQTLHACRFRFLKVRHAAPTQTFAWFQAGF